MPLRSLVKPEEFTELEAAFADAWRLIECSQDLDPLRAAAQRERLAHIIVGLWKSEGGQAADLPMRAVERFLSVISETDIPALEDTPAGTEDSGSRS